MYIYCNGIKTNVEGDLFHAKEVADANACYSQSDIYIIDDDDMSNSIVRRWRGCMDGVEECENAIQIGNSGFYEGWTDCTPREAASVAESPVFEEYNE
jgi:hypothetical protein